LRALLSVSDKNGLIPFARALAGRGWELVSTGGTARALADAGLPVTNVSDVTGFPEMMDGRVKTLHPRVHAGILARRQRPDDLAALAAHGITPIDLVVVNLYPFARAAAREETTVDDLIEEIDIGGPSMVRAAAKNFRDVLIVVDPGDYPTVLDAVSSADGPPLSLRFELARRAIAHTAAYDTMIAGTLGLVQVDDAQGAMSRTAASALPAVWTPELVKIRDLRYGENPHQAGAWYGPRAGGAGFANAVVHQGKELSFTNLLDLDAAARIALEFDEPAAAVIKHTNPCGVATGATVSEAYVTARDADALSAFGGIVGLNRPIDLDTARALTSTFIEAVVAPSLPDGPAGDEVRAVLRTKANLRVVTAEFAGLAHDRDVRSILGAWLVQTRDRVVEASAAWPATESIEDTTIKVVTRRTPTPEEWAALRFAWRVCAHVKSNTVLFAGPGVTLAVGAGQMSRVDAVKAAVMKGGERLRGSVAASDAFFPFRDGLDAVADAGATAVVQPGGSVRDAEVIAAADERGLAMVFTGRRHFRH
jgi:phosphoribosylaminoimidazolecarboxamide formyltransferase/IMP cyclohydrolase